MVEIILFIMFAHLIPLGKGIADITADTDNWSKSIFSEFNPVGFFGPKDPFYYVFMHFMIVTIFFHILYHDILRK